MHLYIAVRGIKHDHERFINELSCKDVPWETVEKGKKIQRLVQVQVRPIQLYEIVFPKPMRDVICNTVFHPTWKGKTQHSKHDKIIWGIRKMLGVEEIPDWDPNQGRLLVDRGSCEVIGIGQKQDRILKADDGSFEGEGL